jgi:hypothetical protein
VGAEIVLHQHDLGRVGKMRVGQILERLGVIDGRVTVGDGVDGAPTASNVPRWMLSQTI